MQSVAVFYVHRRPATLTTPASASGNLCRDQDFHGFAAIYPDPDGKAQATAMAIQAKLDGEWNTDDNPRSHRFWTNAGRYEALVFNGWPPESFHLPEP